MLKFRLSILIILVALFVTPSFAGEWIPVYHPELTISKAPADIQIDGELADPGWVNAAQITRFHEHFPGDQTRPPVETRVLVTYDNDHLYAAFICEDDPSSIRATFGERDVVAPDDNVIIALDTYGDAAWAYEIGANPYGIQYDALWSRNGGEDDSYDLVFKSMGKITDSGYQVEMAIPFSSLRFPAKDIQTWKIDFWRNHPRELRRQSSWAAYDRDESCWPCQWGTITGIQDVESGHGIELLPSIMSYQSGSLQDSDNPNSDFVNKKIDGEASLGAKYSITSGITAEATYNPDFSQIESDATQIDVNSTFALFYPERRPFFQEGSDLFATYFSALYTRSINDPIVAGKLIGRMNSTNLGYLTAYDDHSPIIIPFEESSAFLLGGKSVSNIFRARQTLGNESHIGTIITDRHFNGGGSGSLFSMDGSVKLNQNFGIEFQLLATHTGEPNDTALTSGINDVLFDGGRKTAAFDGESFWGHGIYASFERHARTWWFDLDYVEINPTFRADNGFEVSNNSREAEFTSGLDFNPNSKILASISPYMTVKRKWNFSKEKKLEWLAVGTELQLPGQAFVQVQYLRSWENFRNTELSGIRKFYFSISSKFSNMLSGGGSAHVGRMIARNVDPHPVVGNELDLGFWATFKPIDRMTFNLELDHLKSDSVHTGGNIFKGYAARTRADLQATRELSFRIVAQYNDFSKIWEFDPLMTYRLGSFTVFYLGSTHDLQDYEGIDGVGVRQYQRQFFMKIQYLLQV